ncbi:MAG: dethiobiotin synthase [Pseudohongiellaceae bacterium]
MNADKRNRPLALFVTGTDTGIGKTRVAAGLLCAARRAGWSTAGLKPVASGCEETPDGLRNDDALALQSQTTLALTYEQINPVSLRAAIAPHVAARQEGRRITAERLEGLCRAVLMQRAGLTVIEGAGGWEVPLSDRQRFPDLVRRLETPVVLVVGVRLGCINHAVLTARAILADGLPLAGWVANCIDPAMAEVDATVETLHNLIPAPCLGVLPQDEAAGAEQVADYLDLTALGDVDLAGNRR